MLALPALASLQTSNVSRGTNAGQGAPPSREQQVDSMDIEVTTARLRICRMAGGGVAPRSTLLVLSAAAHIKVRQTNLSATAAGIALPKGMIPAYLLLSCYPVN